MKTQNSTLPHVVILGAGFGGLRVAKSLAGESVRVTLVDRNNYHLFQPLLYQVATSMLSADEIAYPVRTTLRGAGNLSFHLGEVKEINLREKYVTTNNDRLPYDYLVLALGGETHYFGLKSVAQFGFGLKDLDDALNIRNHLLQQFEKAIFETDNEKREALLTFVIAGGGPTGVECAGAISELVRIVLKKDYPTLDESDIRVVLLEAGEKLLVSMPAELGEATLQVLEQKKHVEVIFGSTVTNFDGAEVSLKDGTSISANTLIWAAGVRAVGLLDTLGLEQDRLGRLIVAPTLQVPGYPEVFVIGDAASLEGKDGKPLPMIAPVAMQQAGVVAKNLLNSLQGKPCEEFMYRDPGILATIGRNQAVAHLGRWKLHGIVAWLLWVVIHIYQLVGFRNRLAVLLDWAWTYVSYDRAVRLIQRT